MADCFRKVPAVKTKSCSIQASTAVFGMYSTPFECCRLNQWVPPPGWFPAGR